MTDITDIPEILEAATDLVVKVQEYDQVTNYRIKQLREHIEFLEDQLLRLTAQLVAVGILPMPNDTPHLVVVDSSEDGDVFDG